MRFLILLILPLILAGQNLKIVSYNVQNLFDLEYNGNEYKQFIPYKNGWNRVALNKKLNNISQVICDIDGDIIGLQEIENLNALQLLRKRLKRVGCPYKYYSIANKSKSTVKTAILSRYKIINSREIKIGNSINKRSILETTFNIKNKKLTIFVNHWKSKYHGGRESKRVAYAKVLKKRLSNIKNEYILLGDFNSNYNEYLTIEPKFNDTNYKTGINSYLNTIKNSKLVDINTLLKDKKLHYNLWLDVPKYKRWSLNFYGKKGTPDSIIIPYNMLDNKNIEYKKGSFGVFKSKYLFTKKGYINRKEYSDHLPIYALFYINRVNKLNISSISELKKIDYLENRVKLKNIEVIKKIKDSAIISDAKDSIYIYRVASKLQKGLLYDIVVDKITTYKGKKEITQISNIKIKGE